MTGQAVLFESAASIFEQVTARYSVHLASCRNSLSRDLATCPAARHLKGYFERGKMIRPMLVFLSASGVGGDAMEALPAAEAIELLHVAALIHDDIIDGADQRRGLPALHRRIGEAAALVVGDHLILESFEALACAAESGNAAAVLQAVRLLSRCAQDCCRGQIAELSPARSSAAEQQYFSVVRGKTASQFAAAVGLGAIFGGAGEEECNALRSFAMSTGIAFQIRDDELDLTGDSVELGKPAGNSIEAGRPSLPLIYLAKHGSTEALAAFAKLKTDGTRRAELVRLMEEEGLLERVRRMERFYLRRALAALERLSPTPECDALRAIAVYAVHRNC